jgi:hypothetical protein
MTIKDTSGIKQYLQDQGRSEILALDIKAKYKKKSTTYKQAEALFNQAAGTGDGWSNGILFDAKTKREINVPIQDYKASDAGKSIEAFLKLEPALTTKAFDPVTATAIAALVVSVVDMLEKQNNKRVEEAINVIEEQLSKARWTTFELTTYQWVNEKYTHSVSGK